MMFAATSLFYNQTPRTTTSGIFKYKNKKKKGVSYCCKIYLCFKDTRSLFLFFPNKAREVGRQVRHCADLKLDSAKMRDNIDVLIELLNQGCLATNQEAQSAINDLIKVRFYTVYRM